MKKILIIIITFYLTNGLQAQEILTGLSENPVLKEAANEKTYKSSRAGKLYHWMPMNLPVFEDFKSYIGYPDTNRWIDDEAYVNDDFPMFSANLGAATLDVIDANGYVYSNASIFPFIADHLTSKPIRLDSVFHPVPEAIKQKDSVYFSFYYQPQGRASEPPQHFDSLVLEFGQYGIDSVFVSVDSITVPVSSYIGPNDTIFPGDTLYSPCDFTWGMPVFDTLYYDDMVTVPCDSVFYPNIEWTWIWSDHGMHIDSFYKKHGTYSRQVMIPILDSAKFYRDDFFFRFYNYASLAEYPSWKSNCDQWNVDYIYLNIGRSIADTFYRDIGFVERSPSMLKDYELMPYDQYKNNPTNVIKDTFRLYITNLDNKTFNTIYKYTLTDKNSSFERIYDGGSCNLAPYTEDGYQNCHTCWQHACPPWKFLFPLDYSQEYGIFKIQHVLLGDITSTDTIHDTLNYYQNFYNYYAYDDGTPENGYGLDPAGAMLAYKFKLNRPDTLHTILMFFNRTQENANDAYFDLAVWRDNNGVPGEMIYIQEYEKPKFSESLYKIQAYKLDSAVPVNNVFYIGWIQHESVNLNVGFDRYNNAREFTFYNVTGEWYQSQFDGALMMRPVLGEEIITSVSETQVEKNLQLTVYPNPVTDGLVNIEIDDTDISSAQISIYNLFGQIVYQDMYRRHLNLTHLRNGMYIIRLDVQGSDKPYTSKFIISRKH